MYSTYTFFLHPLPTHPPPPILILINYIFSRKSTLKHTGVEITYIFQDAKFSLTKHKKCLLEAFYCLPKSIDLMQNTSPPLYNPSPYN